MMENRRKSFEYQKDVLEMIETIQEKIKDKGYKKTLIKAMGLNGKAKVNQDCMLISEILKGEGVQDCSEMTVYRILRIQKEDKELYDSVKNGGLKIKQAYNILFPPKQKEDNKEITQIQYATPNIDDEPDLTQLAKELEFRIAQLDKWKNRLAKKPEPKVYTELHTNLFNLRKMVDKVQAYYNDDDEYL